MANGIGTPSIDHSGGFGVLDSAGALHEVHDDFVGDADDDVLVEVVVGHVPDGLVGQLEERSSDALKILWCRAHEEVDILGRPGKAGLDDRHPADDDVLRALTVQVLA